MTSRGDRREDIFLRDEDRRAWLDVFAQVCKRFNWVCHAWCQMTNHYHIMVETVEGNLSQGMRQLNGGKRGQVLHCHILSLSALCFFIPCSFWFLQAAP